MTATATTTVKDIAGNTIGDIRPMATHLKSNKSKPIAM